MFFRLGSPALLKFFPFEFFFKPYVFAVQSGDFLVLGFDIRFHIAAPDVKQSEGNACQRVCHSGGGFDGRVQIGIRLHIKVILPLFVCQVFHPVLVAYIVAVCRVENVSRALHGEEVACSRYHRRRSGKLSHTAYGTADGGCRLGNHRRYASRRYAFFPEFGKQQLVILGGCVQGDDTLVFIHGKSVCHLAEIFIAVHYGNGIFAVGIFDSAEDKVVLYGSQKLALFIIYIISGVVELHFVAEQSLQVIIGYFIAAKDELFIFRPDAVGFLKRPAVGGSHGFHCPSLGKSVVALVCPVLGGSIGFSQILDLHRGHSVIRTRRDKLINYVKFLWRVERVAEHSRSGVTALLLIVFQLDGEVFAVFWNIRHRIYVVNLFRLIKPCAEGEHIRAVPVKREISVCLICVCNPVLAVCDSHIVHRRGLDILIFEMFIIPFLQNGRIVIQAYIVAHFLHHCLACAVFVFVFQLCLIGMRVAFRLAHRDGQKAYARGFVIQAVLGKEVGGEPIALIFRIVC